MPRADKTAEQLHAAIDDDPELAANYLVLADHLLELGDPRGELINLMTEQPQTKATRKRAAALQDELGPDISPEADWRYGFVHTWRTQADVDDERTLRDHLEHPSLRHLIALELRFVGSNLDQRQWLVDLIAARVRPCLRSLAISGNAPELEDLSLAALWSKLPRLVSLRANARFITLGKPRSSTLAELHIDAGMEDKDLRPLLAADLPALRVLSIEADDGPNLRKLRTSPLGIRLGEQLLVKPLDTGRYDRFVE